MSHLLQIYEPGQTPLPHQDDRAPAVGIDLGTTNSVVAIMRGEVPEVLRTARGRALIPSVVAYDEKGGVQVGETARAMLLDNPQAVVSSIKRLMGRGIEDVKGLAGTLPFEVAPLQAGSGGMVRLKIMGRALSPVEISADILRALKTHAEQALGRSIHEAVITVPAYFDDAARSATKDAARLAGLGVLRLVNEPTAAALAYGLDAKPEGIYAVYDLGGGTFDISILRMEKGVFQVLATGGDAALGGDDFDHAVAEHFLRESGISGLVADEVKSALMAARLAKECLSSQDEGEWVFEVGGEITRHHLSRAVFEALIAPKVERTIALCRGVLHDAGLSPSQIKGVVLVGGSTRVPMVRQAVERFFGQKPLDSINPDEVVALGAALQAHALTVGSDNLLLDVAPLSLGLETMGSMVEKIIPRNTPVPVSKAQEFTTYQDGQTAMMIHVVQGEREMVDENRSLARFTLRGIPPMTAGAARIRVTFTIDADGLLTVSAREMTTGTEQHVEVKPSYGLSVEAMATMLRESITHAGEDMERRLLAEAKVDAERSLLALHAAFEKDGALCPDDEALAIERGVDALKAALAGTSRDDILNRLAALEELSRPFAERRMEQGIRSALSGKTLAQASGMVEKESRKG